VASFKENSKVEGWDLENPSSDLCVPGGLLTRVASIGCKPGIVKHLGQFIGLPLLKVAGTGAQVLPLLLQIGESL